MGRQAPRSVGYRGSRRSWSWGGVVGAGDLREAVGDVKAGMKNYRSFKQTVRRLEEAAMTCRGHERVQLLRRWLVALKGIEKASDEKSPEQAQSSDEPNSPNSTNSSELYGGSWAHQKIEPALDSSHQKPSQFLSKQPAISSAAELSHALYKSSQLLPAFSLSA
ncbi:uncharacterized protein A4U43_C08F25270 [Asparagus officinalis]|nr:uncharacterized protein A4U43_C08F25270 [Asparagus officinalis]